MASQNIDLSSWDTLYIPSINSGQYRYMNYKNGMWKLQVTLKINHTGDAVPNVILYPATPDTALTII
jgi:hypothetical protein